MRLLRLAVEKQRWDLAAHTIVFATARTLNKGGKRNAGKNKQKNSTLKNQPKS